MSPDKELDLQSVGQLTLDELQSLPASTGTALDQLLQKAQDQHTSGQRLSAFAN